MCSVSRSTRSVSAIPSAATAPSVIRATPSGSTAAVWRHVLPVPATATPSVRASVARSGGRSMAPAAFRAPGRMTMYKTML